MKVKKLQKKKYNEKKSGIGKYNNEIIGIIMLAISIMALLSFILENSIGVFGVFIKKFIMGLVGLPGYIIPPLLIVYSVLVIFKKNTQKVNMKAIYLLGLLLIMTAMLQTFFYNEQDYVNMGITGCLKKFYSDGIAMRGGGILGGIISIPFLLVFKNLGTIIILTAIAIIDIILITNVSIAGILLRLKDDISGIVGKIQDKLKISKDEIKEKIIEEGEDDPEAEIDIVMNGKKLPKVVSLTKKKDEKAKEEQNVIPAEANKDNIEIITESSDPVVKDAKKKEKEISDVNTITDSVNREVSSMPKLDFEYVYPHTELLDENKQSTKNELYYRSTAIRGAKKLEETLKSFGVDAKVVNVSMGPAVTRYELQPSPGVKVSKIVNLSDDISLNLAASGVRIEAPIPGKAAIGIEVPNKEIVPVFLREVLDSKEFKENDSKLAFALGKDISGKNMVADIAKMPHLLVAGATGSGKSVCINSIIISLLYKASPKDVKLLMVDPKVVELGIYNGIPHLLIPVVTDPKKAAGALNWAVQEMVNRYKLFADRGVRDLRGYNALL
ncbi:MAG TPA: DNA translocase FtsK 4TM domain-containing protein, partial [Acetivibrio sp.]|nr:DNA translocase FtsK 4TM domain-containing protein [Acetivibrio sp.]